jgi:hypothetical protein
MASSSALSIFNAHALDPYCSGVVLLVRSSCPSALGYVQYYCQTFAEPPLDTGFGCWSVAGTRTNASNVFVKLFPNFEFRTPDMEYSLNTGSLSAAAVWLLKASQLESVMLHSAACCTACAILQKRPDLDSRAHPHRHVSERLTGSPSDL